MIAIFGRRPEPPPICAEAPDAFPAEAGPTGDMRCVSGAGFSLEEVGVCAINFAVRPLTSSRLKPVLLSTRGVSRTGFSRERAGLIAINFAVWPLPPSRLKTVLLATCGVSGTGFSREEVSASAINFAVWPLAPSRLKPVLLDMRC